LLRAKFFRPYQGISSFDYTSHEADLLEDLTFFGKVFHWQPSEIENLKWSHRKQLKQAYMDAKGNAK
jgi:hypothetical protein